MDCDPAGARGLEIFWVFSGLLGGQGQTAQSKAPRSLSFEVAAMMTFTKKLKLREPYTPTSQPQHLKMVVFFAHYRLNGAFPV